ncbi:Uma2 family endonuclease [Gloeocapsa sp. BRSZ]
MVTLQLSQIDISPGQRIVLRNVSWQQFENIVEELGEHRGSRVAYSQGTLEIMSPLPEHEVTKGLVGDLVKILLEELEIDCESFGSTTFKRQDRERGVEPDESFYIANYAQMIGRSSIDLTVDPPPDLVIEIDITSKTQLEAYKALKVPELWRFENRQLRIDVLQNDQYIESFISPTFPELPIMTLITEFVEQARLMGRSRALKAFRQWIQQWRRSSC